MEQSCQVENVEHRSDVLCSYHTDPAWAAIVELTSPSGGTVALCPRCVIAIGHAWDGRYDGAPS